MQTLVVCVNLRPVCVSTGMHSLRYHYLDLSEPGPSLPRFLAVGYVDDQPFIRYDSHVDKAEPQAPWIMSENVTYWENETKKQRKWAEIHQVETWIEMGYHNHSTGALGGCPMLLPSPSAHSFSGQLCLSEGVGQASDTWLFSVPFPQVQQGLRASEQCSKHHRSWGPMMSPPHPLPAP